VKTGSNFEDFSGYSAKYVFASNLKSVILLSDWFKAKKEAFKAKHNIGQLSDSAKAELKRPGVEKPKELYKFFTRNLTEAINTFKEHNPNVKIIISTLVGRWPHDTQEQFQSNLGHTWWMVDNRTTRKEAAGFLELLNGVIQDYAKENGLYFVDMRKSFDGLDKQKLFTDFCHLTNEGYEIIAKTFFDYIQKEVEPLQ
jgi:lysophospholipase L1-like esterase